MRAFWFRMVEQWRLFVRNEPIRKDRRTWREVLQEYNASAGRRVPITLPKLKFLEKVDERERQERAA